MHLSVPGGRQRFLLTCFSHWALRGRQTMHHGRGLRLQRCLLFGARETSLTGHFSFTWIFVSRIYTLSTKMTPSPGQEPCSASFSLRRLCIPEYHHSPEHGQCGINIFKPPELFVILNSAFFAVYLTKNLEIDKNQSP